MGVTLAASLRSRVEEIESTIFTRVHDLERPIEEEDVTYLTGLRSAITAAIECVLVCIEQGLGSGIPPPFALILQARRAARTGIRMDSMLRGFAVASNVLVAFIMSEAGRVPAEELQRILVTQGPRFDRWMEFIASEYRDELERIKHSPDQRRANCVSHLLTNDEFSAPLDLDYVFDEAWHVGVILLGCNAQITAQLLSERLGCQSLQVRRDSETHWIWLGNEKREALRSIDPYLDEHLGPDVSAATGEVRCGLDGWRLTHREAQVALQVMLRRPGRLTRAKDVILMAGVMQNETHLRALLDNYLGQLKQQVDSGRTTFETLRSYFSSGENAAAAAANLGVTRQTVKRRIWRVEESLGQPLYKCRAALEVALAIDELGRLGRPVLKSG
jgi:hypothetical protein